MRAWIRSGSWPTSAAPSARRGAPCSAHRAGARSRGWQARSARAAASPIRMAASPAPCAPGSARTSRARGRRSCTPTVARRSCARGRTVHAATSARSPLPASRGRSRARRWTPSSRCRQPAGVRRGAASTAPAISRTGWQRSGACRLRPTPSCACTTGRSAAWVPPSGARTPLAPSRPVRCRRGRVLLVDDVLTTGATVRAAAAALHRGGAGRVDAVTLARVATIV